MSDSDELICPIGDGHGRHDWRLWQRLLRPNTEPTLASFIRYTGGDHWQETWYCTRCRTVQERSMDA